MNVGVQQAKEKNEKTSKREAEETKHKTDFKEAVCCRAIVQGAAGQINGLWRRVLGKQRSSERLTAVLTQPKRSWVEMHGDRTTTLRRLLIVAGSISLQRYPAYRTALLASGRLPMPAAQISGFT